MDDNALHVLLMRGFSRSNREIVKHTVGGGLMPGQPKILEFLQAHDGCSQKDIGAGCILDKSTVTSLLKRMEKGGLVRREAERSDLRRTRVFLTEAGREKARQVCAVMAAIDEAGWQGISDDEKAAFIAVFHRIIDNQKKWDGAPEKRDRL